MIAPVRRVSGSWPPARSCGYPRLPGSCASISGAAGRKMPRRAVPDLIIRAAATFDPGLRSITGELGQEVTYSSEKATRRLGWSPRPIEDTITDCA